MLLDTIEKSAVRYFETMERFDSNQSFGDCSPWIFNFYKGKVFENPKLAILNFTGPGMYTHVMRNYLIKYGLNGVKELDIKVEGQGIFKITGSQFRYHKIKSYTYLKNAKICD